MGLFRALVGMVIEVAKFPVAVAVDVVTAFPDACDPYGPGVGHRTKDKLEDIKDEADNASPRGGAS